MRKLISYLFISLDGVIEAPNGFLREDLYQDLGPLDETLSEQGAVLMGRVTYEEWSKFWPASEIEPFASFINHAPKFVVSKSLGNVSWSGSMVLSGDFRDEILALKRQTGKAIGVHGSISLVQSLLAAGLLDELNLVVCPAIAGQGRRLVSGDGKPMQLDLRASRTTLGGLQFLTLQPRNQAASD